MNIKDICEITKTLVESNVQISVMSKLYAGIDYESNLSKVIEKIMQDYFAGKFKD